MHDEATAAQIRELITKGAMRASSSSTDDVRGLYETLKERGVTDFTQEPTDHFYGTDMGVRDPFGNAIRIFSGRRSPRGDGLSGPVRLQSRAVMNPDARLTVDRVVLR